MILITHQAVSPMGKDGLFRRDKAPLQLAVSVGWSVGLVVGNAVVRRSTRRTLLTYMALLLLLCNERIILLLCMMKTYVRFFVNGLSLFVLTLSWCRAQWQSICSINHPPLTFSYWRYLYSTLSLWQLLHLHLPSQAWSNWHGRVLHIAKVGYFFSPSLPDVEWPILRPLPFLFYQKLFIFRFLENCFWGLNLHNAVGKNNTVEIRYKGLEGTGWIWLLNLNVVKSNH